MATTAKRVRKRIDLRDWTEYNTWQSDEVVLAYRRLRELVASNTIHDWAPRRGRPRVERRVIVLCLLMRAYFNQSHRRVRGLLVLLQPVLGLERVPHYNTIAKYGLEPGLTGTLKHLLDETARPFWKMEKTLTIDSTGLLLQGSGSWRGDHTDEDRRDYAKIHILSGAQRRATLGVRTTRGLWHDAPQLEPLVEDIPEDAVAEDLVGDGAYWNRDCADAARYARLRPYFKPHENARPITTPGDAFERMTRLAQTHPELFEPVYHRRSTSESRNATEKLLFGDRLRTRRPVSRRNEVLARQVVHNARLLTRYEPAN